MTLSGFQLALCDAIATPELARQLRDLPESFLDRYDVTARERRRLIAMSRQPGLATSSAIYRLNRVTPLCEYLPMTSLILGDELVAHAEAYWESNGTDLQFAPEVAGFGAFLSERCRTGVAPQPHLADVLGFEIAINDLRFRSGDSVVADRDRPAHVHPLIRVVAFAHEPLCLLEALSEGRVPDDVPAGEHYVLIDCRDGGLQIVPVATEFGLRLLGLASGASADLSRADDQALHRVGLLVCPTM